MASSWPSLMILGTSASVASAVASHPHDHLDELRAGHREERHPGLPRDASRVFRFSIGAVLGGLGTVILTPLPLPSFAAAPRFLWNRPAPRLAPSLLRYGGSDPVGVFKEEISC